MKFKMISCAVFFAWIGMNLPTLAAQSLVGKWQGTSEGQMGMMTFDKKGYAAFVIDGETYGGKKFESEGLSMTMKYEKNENVEPHTLDLVMYMAPDNTEAGRMVGIYQFTDAKTLILNMDYSGTQRPEKFDPADPNQITLLKIK